MEMLQVSKTTKNALDTATKFIDYYFPDAIEVYIIGSAAKENGSPNDIDLIVLLPDGSITISDTSSRNDIFYSHWVRPHSKLPENLITVIKSHYLFHQEILKFSGWEIDILAITPSELEKYAKAFDPIEHMPAAVWSIGAEPTHCLRQGEGILFNKLKSLYDKGVPSLTKEEFEQKIIDFKNLVEQGKDNVRNSGDKLWSLISDVEIELEKALIKFIRTSVGLSGFDEKRLNLVHPDIKNAVLKAVGNTDFQAYMDGAYRMPDEFIKIFNNVLPTIISIREGRESLYL